MSVWSHIIIEGYCMFDHLSKKKHTYYELIDIETMKTGRKTIMINKNFIPPSKRPKWCVKQNKRRVPQYRYIFLKEKCSFFAYINAEKSDYNKLDRAYKKSIKEDSP